MSPLSECKEQTLGSLNLLVFFKYVLIPSARAQHRRTIYTLRHKWEWKKKHCVCFPLYYLYGFKIMHPVQFTLQCTS